jgi:hypothetical protein
LSEPKKPEKRPPKAEIKETLDLSGDSVVTYGQTVVNRLYGVRQSALGLAAQCEQLAEYVKRKI